MSAYRTLGENIAKRRKEQGLSQVKLGELTGLSQTAITQIENGHVIPRRTNVENIAKALNCAIDDLYMNLPVLKIKPQDIAKLWQQVVEENDSLKQEIVRLKARVKQLEDEKIAQIKERIAKLRAKDQESSSSPPNKIKRGG